MCDHMKVSNMNEISGWDISVVLRAQVSVSVRNQFASQRDDIASDAGTFDLMYDRMCPLNSLVRSIYCLCFLIVSLSCVCAHVYVWRVSGSWHESSSLVTGEDVVGSTLTAPRSSSATFKKRRFSKV
jgi:hypothetical protein